MKVCFSCVVDQTSLLRMQSFNFFSTIKAYTNIGDILFHIVGDHPAAYIKSVQKEGIRFKRVEPFGGKVARFCNKLQQLNTKELYDYDIVIFCDTDIVFTENISYLLDSSVIQGRYVDTSTPALEILENLFHKANICFPEVRPLSTITQQNTLECHCNGGIYIIPTQFLPILSQKWPQWARFCLKELPADCCHHADQVSFAMSMLEQKLPFRSLPEEWNFPLHFPAAQYKRIPGGTLGALHYHSMMDNGGYLTTLGIPSVDAAIRKANRAIEKTRRQTFDNTTYWDYRYAEHPDIGSGSGSRGECLSLKREILYPILSWFSSKSILDVGCGDLEVMQESDAKHYTGLDQSTVAISIAQKKRPDWSFICGHVTCLTERFDVSLCLDVLIHIQTIEEYSQLVTSTLDFTKDTAIFAAYEFPPQQTWPVCFFHEPISQTLRRDPRIGEIVVLGTYRDVLVVMARRKSRHPLHPNDIPLHILANNYVRAPYQSLVAELIDLSRKSFGFFTRTSTRVFEYSWIAHTAMDAAGKKILDIGAGVNPLPLWFSKHNARVVTVDVHTKTVRPADLPRCNEWGFFDYSALDKRIVSYNMDAKNLTSKDFDILYSCSAIEHILRESRESNINHWFDLLNPGGKLLLTIDIVPGTRRLWNYCEGVQVEGHGEHGTYEDLLNELRDSGFIVSNVTFETSCYGSRTDVAMIEAFRP